MKTLSLEGFRVPFAKILATTFLASSLSIVPMAWAEENMPDVATNVMQQFKLSPSQFDNLMLANQYTPSSKRPEAIQALMLQESGAKVTAKSNGSCHGILQIMTTTAQEVLNTNRHLREKYFSNSRPSKLAVEKHLKTDPIFSIEIADKLLAKELDKGKSLEHAILVYNLGSVKNSHKISPTKYVYVRGVMNKMRTIIVPMQRMLLVGD